ncbi:MFS transporter [[Eubacterium] cellulosolvens]
MAIKASNISIVLLSTSHGINHLLQLILPTLLPSLITEFEISHYTAGILVASFALPYSLLQIPVGYLSDIKGRKNIMIFGLFLYSIATLLCGFSNNIIQLGLAQFFAGIGGSTYHPIGIPLISLSSSKKDIGQAQGIHQAGGAVGSFIAPLLAAYIGVTFDWRFSFIFLSLFGLVTGFLLWIGTEEQSPVYENGGRDENPKAFLSDIKIIRLIILLFIFGLAYLISYRALLPFLTTYLIEKHGIRLEIAAQLLALLQIVGIVGSPLFGRLSDRVGRKLMITVLIICQSIIMFLITYASISILPILLGAMGAVAFSTLAIVDGWVTEMKAYKIIGTLIGVVLTATFFAGAIANPLVGYLADQFDFDFSFRIFAFINLIAIPFLAIIRYDKT